MLKSLLIVGAGDAAYEIYAWASPFFHQMGYQFKGFLDDVHPKAFAKITEYTPCENDVFICAIGAPASRMKVVKILKEKNARFINLIHPSAVVLSDLSTVEGLVVAPFVYIANAVKLADHVFINVASSIGHHVEIGEASNISSHCDLTGHVTLGKRVFLGSHACVIPGRIIGDDAIVGAGSAVMRNVLAGVTVIGVPAKRLT